MFTRFEGRSGGGVGTVRPVASPLTRPLARARDVLPDQGSFASRLHAQRVASVLGLALGVTFSVCFLTGLISHAVQNPPTWFTWPARPAGLYRVTQGLHVATGVASIPLLLGKLWTTYPLFWERPAVRSLTHALERLSLLPLVGGSLFLLVTGVLNISYWYQPMGFSFTAGHYWASWITIGGLIVHIGAKISITRESLARNGPASVEPPGAGLGRRGFLLTIGAASATLVVATVGQTVGALKSLSVLAPRRPDVGPQGLPVNKTAKEGGVEERAMDAAFTLTVEGSVPRPLVLTLDQVRSMPQHEAVLPISCVEGWSFDARWRGVQVRELLAAAGADPGAEVRVESLEEASPYRSSLLNPRQVADRDTLLALELNGEPLAPDHGFPIRLIAPNRPGVQQTKWINKVVVV